ncbi:hypothetical protein N7448_003076 [Penicillium atrosanguineum]|uniref:Uncharacterized protein n=1 Tax=Penicillium atrosanguineum TaxID=1132637 RepID=A0A9W9U3J9_9EURO|nr:uncharacterized protein N7443_002051 [Penicillium atrosanguineum]KAJ5121944.1 hypothetical protein N7526_008881 [Penicillium atrosanguineum]KAJ5139668.1 hypothetical protein N7448_003076 [Penicillium atrosanguineum]KAJ5309590.1 hypothetical protein N7443_002051 [Penicillium atrosanguineum]KAJ5315111.1 hypothetical protein N7476_005418 [Penicillium atrosanguineum]
MATAEKPQTKQKQFEVPDYSDEDYDSADDYSDEEEVPVPVQKKKQLQRRQQQPQKQDELEEYSDEDDYSDEYSDEYSDDEMVQGKSMQPYSAQRQEDDKDPNGGMNVIDKKEKSLLDEEGMKLKLELNLEIEIELKAHIHGDLTIALM